MKVRFLGTGTSFGVPVIGCRCEVCSSDDPRNQRTRHGMLVEEEGRRLLVDTPPELRLQLVEAGVRQVDSVFITHPHADHLHGVDDLRIFTLRSEHALPVHVAHEYRDEIRDRFPYVFSEHVEPDPGSTVPDLELRTFRDREPFRAAGFEVTPFGCPHGSYTSYGLRVGDLAVVVDAKEIPEEALPLLEGVRVLAVNALWFGNPHPTHFNVEEAVEAARRIGAERTFLTHMTHRLEHGETAERLPEGVRPAHDGLVVEL